METIGEKLSEKELDEILAHTDVDRDGRINYQGKLGFSAIRLLCNS